jgi:hypothetical protein
MIIKLSCQNCCKVKSKLTNGVCDDCMTAKEKEQVLIINFKKVKEKLFGK